MKAMIIALTVFLLTNSMVSIAQLNPIYGLSYDQYLHYGNVNCPSYNCFILAWGIEDSADTLKGFNIYRNNVFWRFTEEQEISCGSGSGSCLYDDFFDHPSSFWVTVKAVYNCDSVESIANDSVLVSGLIIHDAIEEINENTPQILTNPAYENISILIPDIEPKDYQIQVISQNGQLIKEYSMKNISNTVIYISTNQMSKGMYFINVQMDNRVWSNKLLIIE